MSIWVDANGWPIPPTVLLGCLIAEILYFRGWRVLVKAEQAKRAPMAPSAFTGFDAGKYQWDSRFFWVHMIQHLLLLVVMAPLLVAAAPPLPLWLGLPGWARRLVKVAAKPK